MLITAILIVGCNHSSLSDVPSPHGTTKPQQSGQWVLESYDSTKGYTFSKDGVSYLTKCDRIAWMHQAGVSDPNGLQMDVRNQSQCVELLPYLHKPVLLGDSSENYNGTLYFSVGDKTLFFKIIEAK
jgi:hypothetical protein